MTDEKVAALIRTHIQRYPAIDMLDIYKLLHQAVFGPGHAITAVKAAREWLERETETLAPDASELSKLLVENIHPGGDMVRVHLRPYLAASGSLKKLLDAFIQSSKYVTGEAATMFAWWSVFQRMTEAGGPLANRFSNRTVALIGRTRAEEKWPASHHSPLYDRTYQPAYRVVTRPLAEELLQKQKIPFSVI